MTVGIYAIYWWNQNLIYIGQSINIEKRWYNHLNTMKRNTHTNYKVQEAFNLYGSPDFVIIQECNVEELEAEELYWTKEYNSLNSLCGLNITEPGSIGGSGCNATRSKYSKLQVLLAFRSLYLSKLELRKSTAKSIGISEGLLAQIAAGNSHTWLKHKYPWLYARMLALKSEKEIVAKTTSNTILGINKAKSVIVISPEGEEFTISNRNEFARIHDLNLSCLFNLIKGRQKSTKGWRLK